MAFDMFASLLNPSDDADINDLSPPPSTILSISTSRAGSGEYESPDDNNDDDGGTLAGKSPLMGTRSEHGDQEVADDGAEGPEEGSSTVGVAEEKAKTGDKVPVTDVDRVDTDNESASPTTPRKRKRSSQPSSPPAQTEKVVEASAADATMAESEDPKSNAKIRPVGGGAVRGAVVGYWRDSPVPDPKDKHAVLAFIDVRDRLRTRIQHQTRDGSPVPGHYPLPPGPGGSWVTFERIVFEDYLVGLDQIHVKEFVKLRCDASGETSGETSEQKAAADARAVADAKLRVKAHPPVDNNMPSAQQMAYGIDIPQRLVSSRDPSSFKRRRTSTGFANIQPKIHPNIQPNIQHNNIPPALHAPPTPKLGGPATPLPPPVRTLPSSDMASYTTIFGANGNGAANAPFSQPGDPSWDSHGLGTTRPTRILIGCWNRSSEANPDNRHAVYGVLGTNDMFRVKLVRHTRDGRYVDGNFPSGPGALWIHYDEVDFDPHLRNLNRNEIKEYCRVRQRQIDAGEVEEDRIDNETKAVYEAQQRVAHQAAYGVPPYGGEMSPWSATQPVGESLGVPPKAAATDAAGSIAGPESYGAPTTPQLAADLAARRMESHPPRHSLPTSEPGRPFNHQPPPPLPKPQYPAAYPIYSQPSPSRPSISNAPFRADGRSPREAAFDRDAIEKTGDIARREVTRLGAAQHRSDQRLAVREAAANMAAPPPSSPAANVPTEPAVGQQFAQMQAQQAHLLAEQQVQQQFLRAQQQTALSAQQAPGAVPADRGRFSESENVQVLQRIWMQKEAQRLKHGAEDAKVHAGVKYDRKTTGPFTGKLVSQGTIINIDGEDYVEYRVLTKPSFF